MRSKSRCPECNIRRVDQAHVEWCLENHQLQREFDELEEALEEL